MLSEADKSQSTLKTPSNHPSNEESKTGGLEVQGHPGLATQLIIRSQKQNKQQQTKNYGSSLSIQHVLIISVSSTDYQSVISGLSSPCKRLGTNGLQLLPCVLSPSPQAWRHSKETLVFVCQTTETTDPRNWHLLWEKGVNSTPRQYLPLARPPLRTLSLDKDDG